MTSPVLLACSGGPDSVALVAAAARLKPPATEFVVVHVNHKLRGASSDQDARFVQKLATKSGFRSVVRVARVSKTATGNLEEAARDKRYASLLQIAKKKNARLVLTAHTQDDQAETVFMNFLRGSGGDGLAGMPLIRPLDQSVSLGRPFLIFGRTELHAWADRFGMRWRTDRSNRDERLLRNWIRRRVFPQLELRFPGFRDRLAKMANVFQDEKVFWQQFLSDVEKSVFRSYPTGRLLDLGGLLRYSVAVQRRFLRRAMGENSLTFDTVERLRRWMMSPPSGGRIFQLRRGWTVTRLSKSKGAPSANLFLIKG